MALVSEMVAQVPFLTVMEELPSLLHAVAADTLISAVQSLTLIGYLLTMITDLVPPKLNSKDGRFSLEDLLGRKPAYLANKDSETEDDEDGDDEDDDADDDDDDEGEDYSGDEGEEANPEDDPEANGAGGSDDGEDDDDEEADDEDDDDGEDEDDDEDEEEEEETPQPPAKKRK
uniref:Uncharacterized protein n=1 Tax=Lotus japonicus TaxID=34305 RepID=I3S8Q6_LOTJA|nr:unknown [Lotus japonicus]